jgi:putative protein-disulfide isomerase
MDMRITYLFDPLCGWCYGAGPALEKLSRLDDVTLDLAPTNLFAGEGSRPIDQRFADYAWQNDQRIAQLTGQIFSDLYREHVLGAVGSRFDSGPATLGLVAVSLSEPARELDALKSLQNARYRDGRDNSDLGVVAETLTAAGFVEAARRVQVPDEPLLAAYQSRIAAARADMARFGVQGVPRILLGSGDRRRKIDSSLLYGDFDLLVAELRLT